MCVFRYKLNQRKQPKHDMSTIVRGWEGSRVWNLDPFGPSFFYLSRSCLYLIFGVRPVILLRHLVRAKTNVYWWAPNGGWVGTSGATSGGQGWAVCRKWVLQEWAVSAPLERCRVIFCQHTERQKKTNTKKTDRMKDVWWSV